MEGWRGEEGKIGKESRLSPVINGGIPAWWGVGGGGGGTAEGKDLVSLRKKHTHTHTQRVWHEEKADNYLY